MADIILLIVFVNHIFAAYQAYGFIVHTTLQNLVFTDIDESIPDDVHSEYYFGQCRVHNKTLRFKDTRTYKDLEGKVIFMAELKPDYITSGWSGIEFPRCVYVRARSRYTDIVRYHAFKFNICILSLIVQHTNRIYNFNYYEWYLPVEQKEKITWELYFYY